jgi:hypothetical protein
VKAEYKQPHIHRLGNSQAIGFQEGTIGDPYTSSAVVSSFPTHSPIIKYREIQPQDLNVIKELHQELFPVR